MKKVLIIANLYHAFPRIPGISTYLPEFGWQATIVTPPLDDKAESQLGFPKQFLERARIIEVPYHGDIFWFWRKIFKLLGFEIKESITEQIKESVGIISKDSFIDFIMKWYQTFFAYPDTEKGWKKSALKSAGKVLRKEYFDVILSSIPFPTSHIVAYNIKKKFGLPWVADFRDTWTENPVYTFPNFRKRIDRRLEKKTMRYADAVVTVSLPYANSIESLIKKKPEIIVNGFDPENLNVSGVVLTDKFTITYTGTIYTNKQDPEKFFIALRDLIDKKLIERKDLEVRFYGKILNWLKNDIEKYGLNDIVTQYGTVFRSEVLSRQKESHVLLFFNWEDREKKGLSHLKFFEYLSAQRPILASGGFVGDEIEKILLKTKTGVFAPTVENITDALLNFYKEYKQSGKVFYYGRLNEVKKYSYYEAAKKFSIVLSRITKEHHELNAI
ncbi:MAG: glycosyltransferase [bacterium]